MGDKALKESRRTLKGILAYCDIPLVSIDFNGTEVSSMLILVNQWQLAVT
jgi:glyceraldehyde-3-phosphate dehydrogenase/erythrose-4-phosphate dehydrogenase